MKHTGVSKFEKEIERLSGAADVQAFVNNAIIASPESFWINEITVSYTRKVFYMVEHLLKKDKVPSPIREVILAGVLLSDIAINELKEDEKEIHPILALRYLNKVKADLNEALFEAIAKIILTHEGDVLIKELTPKPGGPEHLVALAHRVVQADFVNITLP